MTGRELLEQVRVLDGEVAELRALRASVLDGLTSTTARMSESGVRGGGDPHKLDAVGELVGEVDAKLRELAGAKRAALGVINALPDSRQRAALLAYYVNCRASDGSLRTWESIAEEKRLSWSSLMRTRSAALAAVEKLVQSGIE